MNKWYQKLREWLLNQLDLTHQPVVRVYDGYGEMGHMALMGHVLRQSPKPQHRFRKSFWRNALALVRLFFVKPLANAVVRVHWYGQVIETQTEKDGFFKLEWDSFRYLPEGWHEVRVSLIHARHEAMGVGNILIPHQTKYGFISDIDDTFLIAHSANMRKRLYLMLTKNARTRKPFEGVVRHYRLLAQSGTSMEAPNPFFYVSSSEWNLFYYIKEFIQNHQIPTGVLLLNQIKNSSQFLQTGQNNHDGKFFRISRLLVAFPDRQFVLLGDDTQRDPYIYLRVVKAFPGRIICAYLRHVGKYKKPEVTHLVHEMKVLGVSACYFTKSSEAIAHSVTMGLIEHQEINNDTGTNLHA